MSFGLKTIIDLRSPSYVPGSEHLKLIPASLESYQYFSCLKVHIECRKTNGSNTCVCFQRLVYQRQSLSVLGEIAQECGT
jgi:hypothetical protein